MTQTQSVYLPCTHQLTSHNKHHTKPVFVFEYIIEHLLDFFLLNENTSLALVSFPISFFGLKSMRLDILFLIPVGASLNFCNKQK